MKDYVLGIGVSIFIAVIATLLGGVVPVIGASVFALFIGLIINPFIKDKSKLNKGLGFTSKRILKASIVLLGAGLNLTLVATVGKYSLYVMVFTLISAFLGGYIVGKILKVNWKMSSLISAGTGICGGSAIAAIAPVIDANETDITYAIAATFIFDIAMILLFPFVGRLLGLSDMAFGLWAGTAVNDTSSVVATGYAFSAAAGEFATVVKLTRTLSIVPIVFIFAIIGMKKNNKQETEINTGEYLFKITPWFIGLFLIMSLCSTLGLFPESLISVAKTISRFFMVMALASIGLKTDWKEMQSSGVAPMFLGFFVSALVVVVSLFAQYSLGQI